MQRLQTEPRALAEAAQRAGQDGLATGLLHIERMLDSVLGPGAASDKVGWGGLAHAIDLLRALLPAQLAGAQSACALSDVVRKQQICCSLMAVQAKSDDGFPSPAPLNSSSPPSGSVRIVKQSRQLWPAAMPCL